MFLNIPELLKNLFSLFFSVVMFIILKLLFLSLPLFLWAFFKNPLFLSSWYYSYFFLFLHWLSFPEFVCTYSSSLYLSLTFPFTLYSFFVSQSPFNPVSPCFLHPLYPSNTFSGEVIHHYECCLLPLVYTDNISKQLFISHFVLHIPPKKNLLKEKKIIFRYT